MIMHDTAKKFGYPATVIKEYEHWCVLLRPAQVTLASLVMVHKGDETQFSAIAVEAFAEMARVTHDIETALGRFHAYDKINYLMLMMVDRQVHFHVIPRYGKDQVFAGLTYCDSGWPGVPDLASAVTPGDHDFSVLLNALRDGWP